MIIIEGMDNSGKTTLSKELLVRLKDHKDFKLSTVDKPTTYQLNDMAIRIEDPKFTNNKLILDRFSFISELVYGEVLRGQSHYGTVSNWEILLDFIKYNPVYLIYCRPSNRVILNSMGNSKQMSGVDENSLKLIKRYDEVMVIIKNAIMTSINPGLFLRYDWENQNGSLDSFLELYNYQGN